MTPIAIASLDAIADAFDDVLLDQWGVLHVGGPVFDAARDAVRRLRRAGKRVVVLSNSGKRADDNIRRLAALGLPAAEYDALMTSGEAAWQGLCRRTPPYDRLGRRCHLIARGGDRSAVDGAGLTLVDRPEAAEFILLAGLDDAQAQPEAWRLPLAEAARRGVPMLCSNPDLVMFGAHGLAPAPGAVAALYAELGGPVDYVGKPHAPLFAAALALLPGGRPERTLMVGDSLDHDILGGNRAGLATVLVGGGVHRLAGPAPALARAAAELAGRPDRMPRWVMPALA